MSCTLWTNNIFTSVVGCSTNVGFQFKLRLGGLPPSRTSYCGTLRRVIIFGASHLLVEFLAFVCARVLFFPCVEQLTCFFPAEPDISCGWWRVEKGPKDFSVPSSLRHVSLERSASFTLHIWWNTTSPQLSARPSFLCQRRERIFCIHHDLNNSRLVFVRSMKVPTERSISVSCAL